MARIAELPDGTELEFPDETPDAVMDRAVRSHLTAAPDFSNVTAGQGITGGEFRDRLSPGEVMSRAGALTGRAAAQGIGSLADMALWSPRYAVETLGGELPNVRGAISEGLDAAGVRGYDTPAQQAMGNVAEAMFGAAATAGLGGAAPATQIASAATGAGAAEAVKAAGGGQPAQMGAALLGGLAPGGATSALRRAGNAAPIAEKAARQGIPLRAGNVDPGAIGQAVRSIPGTGAQGRYAADVAKVNDRLADLIGAPKGTAPDQIYPAAVARNGAEFDDFARNYSLTLDQALLKKLTDFRNAPEALDGPKPAVKAAVDQFLDEAARGGSAQVPGGLFKQLDTALTGPGTSGLRNALRDRFRGGMPAEDATRWTALMRRYGDMKTVRDLYAKAAGQPIDPRALLARVTSNSAGKERMAQQTRGDLGELAEVGRYVLPPKEGLANVVGPGALTLGAGGAGALSGGAALPAAAAGYGFGNLFGRLIDLPVYTPAQQQAVRRSALLGTLPATQRNK